MLSPEWGNSLVGVAMKAATNLSGVYLIVSYDAFELRGQQCLL